MNRSSGTSPTRRTGRRCTGRARAGGRAPCSAIRSRAGWRGDVAARRALFERLGQRAARALIITEGLLIYMTPDEVGALAGDLAAQRGFRRWILDMVSPGLLRMMQKRMGAHLSRASAPFKFGPEEGPGFFIPFGWRPADVRSIARTAVRQGRAPLLVR